MRSTFGLAVLATLVATVGLTGPGSATARAPETCFGQPATITALPGTDTLEGTEGDDVIVAEDVTRVRALGGDDRVCSIGSHWVDAGDGNDLVSSRTSAGRHYVILGSGSDLFEGSDGRDLVWAELWDGEDAYPGEGPENTDTVRTYGGRDTVTSGDSSQPNQDRVALGQGADRLVLASSVGGDVLAAGGPGRDGIELVLHSADSAPAAATVDLQAGTIAFDRAPLAIVAGFQDASVWAGVDVPIELRGTDEDNDLVVRGRADVAAGAGQDDISLHGDPISVVGGPGRDLTHVVGYSDLEAKPVVYDLGRRLFQRGEVSARLATEELDVGWTGALREDVLVLGSDRDDVVRVRACGAVVRGGPGDDRLESLAEQCEDTVLTLRGGTGADVLLGSVDREDLIGGRGRDRASGREGLDRCRAEVEHSCELD